MCVGRDGGGDLDIEPHTMTSLSCPFVGLPYLDAQCVRETASTVARHMSAHSESNTLSVSVKHTQTHTDTHTYTVFSCWMCITIICPSLCKYKLAALA